MTAPRQWKMLDTMSCKGGWIVVSYAIPTLHGDMDSEGEEALMALAMPRIAEHGTGAHMVRMGRRSYTVFATATTQPPRQGERWHQYLI